MRALVYLGDSYKIEDLPLPVPGPDDVLLRVQSVLLEEKDVFSPVLSMPTIRRHIPGRYLIGTILTMGEKVPSSSLKLRVGLQVMALLLEEKGCAEFTLAPAVFVFPLSYLSDVFGHSNHHNIPVLLQQIHAFSIRFFAHFLLFFQAKIMPHDNVALFGADLPFTQQLSVLLRQENIDVVHFSSCIDNETQCVTNQNEQSTDTNIHRFHSVEHPITIISERDPTVHCQADVILDPFGVSHLSVALSYLKRSGGRILLYSNCSSDTTAKTYNNTDSNDTTDTLTSNISNETITLLFRRNVMLQFANIHRLDNNMKRELREHFDYFQSKKTNPIMAPNNGTLLFNIIERDFSNLKDIEEAFRHNNHNNHPSDKQPKAIVLHFNSVATAVSELSQELNILLHQKHRLQKCDNHQQVTTDNNNHHDDV